MKANWRIRLSDEQLRELESYRTLSDRAVVEIEQLRELEQIVKSFIEDQRNGLGYLASANAVLMEKWVDRYGQNP